MNCCLKALAAAPKTELFVCNQEASVNDPFDLAQFQWMKNRYEFAREPDAKQLLDRLEAFKPDLLLGGVWNIAGYRYVCRRLRNRCPRICLIDNQWRGTAKQWLGSLTAPWYLHRFYDGIFAPGERQVSWARHMGFSDSNIWRGSLTCNVSEFERVHCSRQEASSRKFLYLGRLSQEKGIEALACGYRQYRNASQEPWPLHIAGVGPLRHLLENIPGVVFRGFVQPEQVPQLFLDAGCLVLPSKSEQWGVAIHEAAASGVPVICTSACGASVHLVQDRYNGFVIPPNDPCSIAAAFAEFASLPPDRRNQMGNASASLALQFTPERWANTVLDRGSKLIKQGSSC
jgi:glycosyltransferase involved in cell wall biosynthesis